MTQGTSPAPFFNSGISIPPPVWIQQGNLHPTQDLIDRELERLRQKTLEFSAQTTAAAPLTASTRHFFEPFSILSQEQPEEKKLSKELQEQIWVGEPEISYDLSRNVIRVSVKKNQIAWQLAHHIDDAIVTNTPKAYIADGRDTEFYDEEGQFICGIVHQVDVEEGAIDKLAPLALSRFNRGAAAGLLLEPQKMIEHHESLGRKVTICTPWELKYTHPDLKQEDRRCNQQYSSTYGIGRKSRTPGTLVQSRQKGLDIAAPYFKLLSDCFKQKFNKQYASHVQAMASNGGSAFYLANSVFSTIAINHHAIGHEGTIEKNSRAAIHTDDGHHKAGYEVMLTLKHNIEGGDLFLPEYGILLKLQDCSVTCFKGSVIKHAVTSIRQANHQETATRVTAVAFVRHFGNAQLQKAKAEVAAPATAPRVHPIAAPDTLPIAAPDVLLMENLMRRKLLLEQELQTAYAINVQLTGLLAQLGFVDPFQTAFLTEPEEQKVTAVDDEDIHGVGDKKRKLQQADIAFKAAPVGKAPRFRK